jgi:hypothetical protein
VTGKAKETIGLHSGKTDFGDTVRHQGEPFIPGKPVTNRGAAPRTEKFGPLKSQIEHKAQHRAQHKARRPSWVPSLAAIVMSAAGLGLCVAGLAATVAPRRPGVALGLFWIAIVFPFIIFTTVLIAARPSVRLRKFTISAVGLYPSLVYRLSSPLVLGGFDEHLHEQELLNLLHGSGLFAANPMLRVGPNYPGLELFTGVVTRLAGMPAILAMSIVVLFCRLLFVLTIYNASLTVSPSHRVASLAVIFYAISPQFFFFNSQFAYQTMALTLGLGGIFLLRRATLAETRATSRRFSRAGTLALLATVVTHHVTSWIVLAFLFLWTIAAPANERRIILRATSIMGVAVVCWSTIIANKLLAYMGPLFDADLNQVRAVIAGSSQRKIFGGVAGAGVTPHWEQAMLVLYSLICACAAVTAGWILLSRAIRNRDRTLGLLGILCSASPITLAAHFVPSAADMGDRASTFFFLPLALSCSLVVMRDPRVVRYSPPRRRHASAVLASLICVTSVAYTGGVLLGSGPDWEKLPGPYLVSADPRTQDAETLAAVRWASTHLSPGAEVVADRVPADLLESQARLWPVTVPQHRLDPAWLYFSTTWSSLQTGIVKGLKIQYIYVDQRLAGSLPHVGFYFYRGETAEPRHITADAMTKFSHVSRLRAVYRHWPIAIYDTSGLGVKSQAKGFIGERTMGLGRVGDALLGALAGDLIMLYRRRLTWVESAFRDIGAVGSAITVAAVCIFAAGILFEFCSMPGPSFSGGVVVTVLLVAAVERRLSGKRLLPHITLAPRLDYILILLGILFGLFGIAAGIHAAWLIDVNAVEAILRKVQG